MTNLTEMPVGELARVKEINLDNVANQRLLTMGLLPGMTIRVMQVAPLGDPIAVEFNGQQVGIRLAEAAGIEVERD